MTKDIVLLYIELELEFDFGLCIVLCIEFEFGLCILLCIEFEFGLLS